MWVVPNDALLTNHACLRKGLATQDNCYLCGNVSETKLHALWYCPITQELWTSVGNSFISASFFQQPLLKQLENNMLNGTCNNAGIIWPLLFLTACNSTWHCRNLVILEGITNARGSLVCKVMRLARDYERNLIMLGRQGAKFQLLKMSKLLSLCLL